MEHKLNNNHQMEYQAGIERIVASIIDNMIIFIPATIILVIALAVVGILELDPLFAALIFLIWYVILIIGELILHSFVTYYYKGQSPGKKIMKIKIVDKNGKTPSISRLFLRRAIFMVLNSVFGVFFLLVIFLTEKKQGIHDLVTDTFVVKAE